MSGERCYADTLIGDPVVRAFAHLLAAVDIDDPDAVCWAILSVGQTMTGNAQVIERAIKAAPAMRADQAPAPAPLPSLGRI